MSDLQILADNMDTLGLSLTVAIFVFVVVIIPLLIVFAHIYNRRADRAEERAAAAQQADIDELIELGRQAKLAMQEQETLPNAAEEADEPEDTEDS